MPAASRWTREIHAVRDTNEFLSGLEKLRVFATNRTDAVSCLVAVATLQRTRTVLKRQASGVTEILKGGLNTELPSLQHLGEADERYYVASALDLASGSWVAEYAARELGLETLSDHTAKALAVTLLRLKRSVEEALGVMLEHADAIPREMTKPADAAARRLRRILNAVRGALRTQHFDTGAAVAKPLRTYMVAALERHGAPGDQKVVKELVDATAGAIDDLIRTKLSLVVASELYLVLSFPRRWAGSLWSAALAKSTAAKKLGENLLEGISISARQGITDQGLMDAAELVFGGRDKALTATGRLADAHVGLPENVQSWLRRGRVTISDAGSSLVAQHELLQADQYVATALLAALEAEKNTSATTAEIGEVLKAVKELAGARHMESFGVVGTVVDYSRGSHAVLSGVVDATKVRIVRPGVERVGADSVRAVVIKALVETLRGQGE